MKIVRLGYKLVINEWLDNEKTATHSLTIWDKKSSKCAVETALRTVPTLKCKEWGDISGMHVSVNGISHHVPHKWEWDRLLVCHVKPIEEEVKDAA